MVYFVQSHNFSADKKLRFNKGVFLQISKQIILFLHNSLEEFTLDYLYNIRGDQL